MLTAAVCYDATDLALIADLRNVSDVLATPSFDMDVRHLIRCHWLYTITCIK